MGLLETLRGEGTATDVCKFSREHYEVTYTVSTDTHDVAYAIAVGEGEVDALRELVEADRAAEDRDDSLSAALEATLDDDDADPDAVLELMRRPRRVTEAVVGTWTELLADDPDVVYLPLGMTGDLAAFVAVCRERADGDGAFELPDSFERVAALLVRIKEATERAENRVVVHRDRLPTLGTDDQTTPESDSSDDSS